MPKDASRIMPKPQKPFYFNTSEHLLRIGRQKVNTLCELLQGIETCPDDSIFQHTFRTLQEHHFIRQGFSNDFAHWTISACHEPALAEQLASVDVREFTAIEGLRRRMVEILTTFCKAILDRARVPHMSRFISAPPTLWCCQRRSLPTRSPDFFDGINQVSVHSIHHHFIEVRLRLHRMSNDFSQWLEEEVGLREAADAIERIDFYTNTMEGVRRQIALIVSRAMNK